MIMQIQKCIECPFNIIGLGYNYCSLSNMIITLKDRKYPNNCPLLNQSVVVELKTN